MSKISTASPFSKPNIELLAVIIFFLGAFLIYTHLQPSISYEKEYRLDGNQYFKIYANINDFPRDYQILFPFNTRIAVPFLASLVPHEDVIVQFKCVHFILLLLTVVVLFKILQASALPLRARIVLWLFFFFHWLGPIRFAAHEPLQTDASSYLFHALFVWFLMKERPVYVALVALVAIPFKESLVSFLLILAVFYLFKKRQKETMIYGVGFVFSLMVLYMLQHYFPSRNEHWQHHGAYTILRVVILLKSEPLILIRWLSAIVATFGGFLWVLRFSKKQLLELPTIMFFAALLLSLVSGADHSRIMFAFFPIFVWFMIAVRPTFKAIFVGFLLCVPFMHLFSTIPDITNEAYSSWFTEYADLETIVMIIGYGVVSVLLCYFMKHKWGLFKGYQ